MRFRHLLNWGSSFIIVFNIRILKSELITFLLDDKESPKRNRHSSILERRIIAWIARWIYPQDFLRTEVILWWIKCFDSLKNPTKVPSTFSEADTLKCILHVRVMLIGNLMALYTYRDQNFWNHRLCNIRTICRVAQSWLCLDLRGIFQ